MAQSSGAASSRAASLPCWEDVYSADARQHAVTAQSSGAASSRATSLPDWKQGSAADARQHAYTPQELAEHLEKLKQEFRHICSSLDDVAPKHSQYSSGTTVSCPLHSTIIVRTQSPQLNHCCEMVSGSF